MNFEPVQHLSNQWPFAAQYCLTFTHSCTHSRRSQPCQATAVRCLAQGHHDTRTSNLWVTSQPALPPEPLASPFGRWCDSLPAMVPLGQTWMRVQRYWDVWEKHRLVQAFIQPAYLGNFFYQFMATCKYIYIYPSCKFKPILFDSINAVRLIHVCKYV